MQDPETDATLVGKVTNISEDMDLALVFVKGLSGEPIKFALEGLKEGRKIYVAGKAGTFREGVVHSFLAVDNSNSHERVQHTVPIGEGEFGAPLLNNCKELVGINQNRRVGVFNHKLLPSKTFGVATSLAVLTQFLTDNKVEYSPVSEACLSEEELLARLEKEKQEQSEVIAQAQKDTEEKEKLISKLAKEKEEKQKALELAEEDRQDREEDLKEAERLQKEKDEELAKVAEEKAEQEKRLAEIEAQKLIEAEARDARKKQQVIVVLGAVAVLLLLGGLAVYVLVQRKKQLQLIQQKNTSTEHELSVERAKYEAVQEELEHASATFSDILFIGKDESGNEQRVKIDGDTLARLENGGILGRSGQNANFILNVPGVSREHCRLLIEDGELHVQDLESFNGTCVKGRKLVRDEIASVHNGDDMKIGTVTGKVHFLD